jgi:predicted nucleic acid-binding protein
VILLDTNVLVYSVDTTAAIHAPCHAVVARAMSGKLDAVIVPQVLMEFYAVVTSPRRVRSPLSPDDGAVQIADWRRTIAVRYPTAQCLDEWTTLVRTLQRAGQDVHDLFLIAQMRAHGISDICTANAGDFAGVTGITARQPHTVA